MKQNSLYKHAVVRLFVAFAALESFRLCYSHLCLRISALTGFGESSRTIYPLYCLAVVAGMALAPIIMDKARLDGTKTTPFLRILASLTAIGAIAGYFINGAFALALQFFATALASGALAVCLRQMTLLLPPRRVGLFVGLSCAIMSLSNALLFFQPFIELPDGIFLGIICGFLAAAFFCFNANRFEAAAKLIPMPSGADKLPNKRFLRFALLILCLYVLLGGLLDNLYYFDATFGQTQNFMFYLLLFTAAVDIVSGFAFERFNAATIMICAFALIFAGQALSLFAENTLMVFPYALLSNAGNTIMEIQLIALPIAYCAASRRAGIMPGLGYILLFGGFFAVGVLMPGVDQSFVIGAALLIAVAAIIAITYLINEVKAVRLSLLRKDFLARFSDSGLSGGPSIERFASSYGLSGHETEILRHLLDDKSISYIAAKMNMAEKAIQNSVNSLLCKTGAKTISEAISLFKRMAHQALVYQDIRRALNS